MEANYARYLSLIGARWKYEPEIFLFPYGSNRFGIKGYCPDFKVTNGKSSFFVEVKGYMDIYSAEKIRLFQKYNKRIKLYIVGQEEYQDIKQRYAHRIKHWE